ncbi:hypothetical protein [Geochorda subterranea]|uniref:Radical SAM protein with 4Fe4S-binding SPASM domain n=1 Tax=Geochorda subterranea TaxID=3109564 RepID=A0ABZ1BM75_9FIRM|nr:hypothetical protein [Limnochorda sp. LNt]WRP13784.1 hypothetical protein VLY81_10095 [Limnochorda sp. LNt]
MAAKVQQARAMLRDCRVCPRDCRVNRWEGRQHHAAAGWEARWG